MTIIPGRFYIGTDSRIRLVKAVDGGSVSYERLHIKPGHSVLTVDMINDLPVEQFRRDNAESEIHCFVNENKQYEML